MAALVFQACDCRRCASECCPEDRPYPIVLSWTWTLNLVPGGAAFVVGLMNINKTCADNLSTYLIVFSVLALINLIFSCYLYRQFEIAQEAKRKESTACCNLAICSTIDTAFDLVCYDVFACMYSLVWVGLIVLNVIAIGWLSTMRSCGSTTGTNVDTLNVVSTICVYIGLVFAIGSLCVAWMSVYAEEECRDRSNPNPYVTDEDIEKYHRRKEAVQNCGEPAPARGNPHVERRFRPTPAPAKIKKTRSSGGGKSAAPPQPKGIKGFFFGTGGGNKPTSYQPKRASEVEGKNRKARADSTEEDDSV